MATVYQTTRRTSGAAGPPASLRSGQMFYNMVDGKLYIGKGDNGSGVATSISVFANDSFTGQGTTYTASGGVTIVGTDIRIDAANLPTIDASKVSTGTFAVAQIPGLPANKITSGTFGNAYIADLDASKLTGTIDPARLPVLPGTVQIVSTGGIANLDAGQQASIGDGSVVTTTDGRRWIYTGSGSKTSEASYIEMADITPEWSVIANKPTFATVATSGVYNDLSGRPTLGTMASQNANAVAITGGTIDGVILDGGVI